MGIGLQGLDRGKYFLSCKTKKRDAEGARLELENSLKKLKTDHFDLYQLHHLVKPEEVKQALGPGGAMEAILKAKDQGKLKWIGYSAHTTKSALEVMKGFKFDTVMFPINFVEYYTRGFGKEVLALAQEQGAAVISIKPLSWGQWPQGMEQNRKWWYRSTEEAKDAELAMRFVLSQPGVVTAIPTSFFDLLDVAIAAAKNFKPLDEPATVQLKQMAEGCGSIFAREEKMVAQNWPVGEPSYPGCPHAYA
jgi:predicted aldo/keto reductase-like oxidoreductase